VTGVRQRDPRRVGQLRAHHVGGAQVRVIVLTDENERGHRQRSKLVDHAVRGPGHAPAETGDGARILCGDRAGRSPSRGELRVAPDRGGRAPALEERPPPGLLEAGCDALDLRLPSRLCVRVLEAGSAVDQEQRADGVGVRERVVQRRQAAEREPPDNGTAVRRGPREHVAHVVDDVLHRIDRRVLRRLGLAVTAVVPEHHAKPRGDERVDLRAEVLVRLAIAAREEDGKTFPVRLGV
jgi:hypothetical protein